ncbi:MAG: SGNH/GDSL hydrolase family protein [Arenimonas sp.]
MALRYLALGDSYTIGEGVADGERWPQLWTSALARIGNDVAPPRILARTGWTTDELAAAMDAGEPLGTWDLVTLLIGVNDQYRGRTAEQFAASYSPLLRRAIALADDHAERVLALSIPDWGVTAFAKASGRDRAGIAAQIDAFNAVARAECARQGVAFLDITGLTREAGMDPAMLVDDGLHPSAAMYRAWVEKIFDDLA